LLPVVDAVDAVECYRNHGGDYTDS